MIDKIEKNARLIKYLLTHKAYVAWAGLTMVGGLSLKQLLVHDTSKFSWEEYQNYRRKFRPLKNEEPLPDRNWEQALVHHYGHNPHHPEHWRLGNRLVPMPDHYIKEMLADWLGAGRALTGSWDMSEFLDNRFESFNFHPETAEKVVEELRAIGYVRQGGKWGGPDR